MSDDSELLRRFAADRSDDAFTELVRRHIDLVYSAALRQLGGAVHRAEDVTQSVFIDLARKAGELSSRSDLVGWLYTSAHYAAAKLKRAEQRRQLREQEAHLMHEGDSDRSWAGEWSRLQPVLDDVMHELSESDREAVLMRFFKGRRFGELSRTLGVSEPAARMRVERALAKLRTLFERRGITSSVAAIGLALEQTAVTAAPAGLAGVVTSAVGAGIPAASGAILFSLTKLHLALAAGIVAGAAGWTWQAHANVVLRAEAATLVQQQRLASSLQTENERRARGATEIAALRQDDAEWKALRDQAVALRSQAWSAPSSTRASEPVAPAEITIRLPVADLQTVLKAYESLSDQRIIIDPAVAGRRGIVHVPYAHLRRDQLLDLLRKELREQAGIVLDPAGSQMLMARVALPP